MIWCGVIPMCVCMIKGHSDKMVWIIHSQWCGVIPMCVCMIKGHSDKMVWIIHSQWCGVIPMCVCMIKGHSDKMVWIIHSTPLHIARGLYGPNKVQFLVLSPLHLYFCYGLNHHWSPCSDPKESSLNIISPIFNIFSTIPNIYAYSIIHTS